MIFLLDTNAFSDLMRKHSKLDARMSSLSPADRVVICTVVRGEICYGIEQLPPSKRRQDLEGQAGPLFAVIPLSLYHVDSRNLPALLYCGRQPGRYDAGFCWRARGRQMAHLFTSDPVNFG